jgi:hypothetical protein
MKQKPHRGAAECLAKLGRFSFFANKLHEVRHDVIDANRKKGY